MKFKLISLALICLLIFPNISYAADLNNENITENGATEAVITDENGNKISIPIEVYEPVKEIGNSPMMLDGLTDSDVEKYHQDFSVTIDKEAVENAVARAGGEYSDTTYDGSYTIKLWGRLYFDKKISLDINGEPQDTYRITQMEGHFKNIQFAPPRALRPHACFMVLLIIIDLSRSFCHPVNGHKTAAEIPKYVCTSQFS